MPIAAPDRISPELRAAHELARSRALDFALTLLRTPRHADALYKRVRSAMREGYSESSFLSALAADLAMDGYQMARAFEDGLVSLDEAILGKTGPADG